MRTFIKRFVAGATITILASAMNACSPVIMAPERPRPVVVATPDPEPVYEPAPPVQTVVVQPVVPVWAPPYAYVTEVHYYYFPDYMVYYDVFGQDYVYYNGYSWLTVAVLPSMPIYYGFSPYNSYVVVLNRNCDRPWYRHDYYEQQYPRGYYNTVYAPRQSMNSNTVLRAYDENQSRPLFVNRQTNREVTVKYDTRPMPRTAASSVPLRNNQNVKNQTLNGSAQSMGAQTRTNNTYNSVPVVQNQSSNGSVQGTRGDVRTNNQNSDNTVVQNPSMNGRVIQNQNADASGSMNNNSRNVYQNPGMVSSRGNVVTQRQATVTDNRSQRQIVQQNNIAPSRNVMPMRPQAQAVTAQPSRPSSQRMVPATSQPVRTVQQARNVATPAPASVDRRAVQGGNAQVRNYRQGELKKR